MLQETMVHSAGEQIKGSIRNMDTSIIGNETIWKACGYHSRRKQNWVSGCKGTGQAAHASLQRMWWVQWLCGRKTDHWERLEAQVPSVRAP